MSMMYRRLSYWLQIILIAQVVAAVYKQHWATAFFTFGIILLTLAPLILAKQVRIYIPPQFQLLTIAIVFAALFLGEIRGYYTRFWWWDAALHAIAGFLMGILGFLLMYVFNEMEETRLRMRTGFVPFFAFMFALGVGAIWEVMEFILDRLLDMDLQKAMLGDPSGLTDTMVDLMVDAFGAGVICLYGYYHLRKPHRTSFLERWIGSFIENNPRLFRRKQRAR